VCVCRARLPHTSQIFSKQEELSLKQLIPDDKGTTETTGATA
jgi:hypothetical protein